MPVLGGGGERSGDASVRGEDPPPTRCRSSGVIQIERGDEIRYCFFNLVNFRRLFHTVYFWIDQMIPAWTSRGGASLIFFIGSAPDRGRNCWYVGGGREDEKNRCWWDENKPGTETTN